MDRFMGTDRYHGNEQDRLEVGGRVALYLQDDNGTGDLLFPGRGDIVRRARAAQWLAQRRAGRGTK